jgi:Tol biopolymer transport system component
MILDSPTVHLELNKILASSGFANSPRMSRFLTFVVEETLAGNSGRIKEYVIALEVFDKDDSYDPHADSTVRTEAGKLRAKLNRYYETEGRTDPLVISIPKGSYVPVFDCRQNGLPSVPSFGATAVADVQPAAKTEVPTQITRGRWIWSFVGLCFMFSITAVVWLLAKRDRVQSTNPVPVPLTSYPGQELQPSFSPDGNEIAFTWNGEKQDNFDIYRKQIGTDQPLRLTTDRARDFSPAWSPDGRSIAFMRVLSPVRSGIFLIPALGGPERKVGETASLRIYWSQPSISWSPDSKWLAFSDVDPENIFTLSGLTPASLFLLSVETGEKRRLTSHALRPAVDAAPAFATDGRALAFVRMSSSPISDLYLIPFSSGFIPAAEPRRLTSLNRFTTSPAWTPDQKELLFASGSWENTRLWRVPVSGTHAPRRLDFAGDHTDHPAISHQGRLAFSQMSSDVNIWRTDLSQPGGKAGPPISLIASTHTDINPQFSPDGKRIAFCSDRSGSMEVWICDRDGSNAMQVTSMGAAVTGSPRWSPDGMSIVYDSNKERQFEVYVISASGGTPQRMTNNPAIDGAANWSRDGHWIYFMSNRSGARQIWKMPAAGGTAVQVTRRRGHVSFESPDGAFLYFSTSAAAGDRIGLSGLWRVPVNGGEETPVLPSVTFLNFALSREGIYFIPRADVEGHYAIQFFSFASRKSWEVLPLGDTLSTGLSVSPDSRSLLYTQSDAPKSDLMLVDNFH